MLRWLLAMTLVCATGTCLAHPIAASIGEAHWRPARGVFEIAIRLPTHDVQTKLKTVNVQPAALKAWVLTDFRVDGVPPTWVGAEVKPDSTWIYLEAKAKAGARVTLRHGLLFDISPMQVNTLNLSIGVEKLTLGFTPAHAERSVLVPGD